MLPLDVRPAERGERHHRRRVPGVEHVRVARQRACPHRPSPAPRPRCARRRRCPARRTRPGSGGPTTVAARCTSPGCSRATGCRSCSTARERCCTSPRATASSATCAIDLPGWRVRSACGAGLLIAMYHCSESIGSTTSPVRPQRGTIILCGFSETTSPGGAQILEHAPCARHSDRGRGTSPARCR